jgi:putative MATE family efflux protein
MTTGKEWKHILWFSIPMLLGNLLQQGYVMIDRIIVGNYLGEDALAAVGTSFPIMFLMIALIMGMTMGSTIVIAQYFGAKDMEKAKRTIDTTYVVLAGFALALTAVGILASPALLRLLDTPPEIFGMADTFLKVIFSGLLFSFGYNSVAAILRGLGDSKTPLVFLAVAVALNFGLEVLFVGPLRLGIAGAAAATVLSQAFSFFFSVFWLRRKHGELFHFNPFRMTFDRAIFGRIVRIGVPTGIQQVAISLGMLALQGLVNGYGTSVISGYTAALSLDAFAILPALSMGLALTAFVGQNVGARQPGRVRNGFRSTMILSNAVTLAISALLYGFARPLIGLFANEPAMIQAGVDCITKFALFYFIFNTLNVLNSMMRGYGDGLSPLAAALTSLFMRLACAYLISASTGVISLVWWSIPIGWLASLALSAVLYRFGKWRKMSPHGSGAELPVASEAEGELP